MKKFVTLLFFFSLNVTVIYADDIETIIKKYEANSVYESVYIESSMATKNSITSTENSFKTWNRKNGDTLIEIDNGPDKGQKILRQGSSIFLYYPEAEEIIRLQGSSLKNSLMGSDFSYEDLTGENSLSDRFTAELSGNEIVDDHPCWHIILTAKNSKETYRKEELWVDCELYVSRKTILYSASGRALRELLSSEIKNFNGFNVATKMEMHDLLKKNSKTLLYVTNIIINKEIDEKIFSRENLTW